MRIDATIRLPRENKPIAWAEEPSRSYGFGDTYVNRHEMKIHILNESKARELVRDYEVAVDAFERGELNKAELHRVIDKMDGELDILFLDAEK